MSNPQGNGEVWAGLANLGEADRERQMEDRYTELASWNEDERSDQMRSMAAVEYALPDDKMRPFHLSRLRVWLRMGPEAVRIISASYDAVLDQMPADVALRRIGLAQSLIKAFSLAEQEQLRSVLPRVFGDRGTAVAGWTPSDAGFPRAPRAKKALWAFWSHS